MLLEWEYRDRQMADEERLKGQREGVEGKRSQCCSFPKESDIPAGPRTIKLLFILSGVRGGKLSHYHKPILTFAVQHTGTHF